MNKKIYLLPLLLTSSFLASCEVGGSKDKNYNIVQFNYNLENNKGTYTSLVVMNGSAIEMPKDPNASDLIFEGWYKNPECTEKYLRWGLEIDSNFTLYANWTPYESASLETKITKFQDRLNSMSQNVCSVVQDCQATIGYPGVVGSEYVYSVHDKYIYTRYSDITTKDYYQITPTGYEEHYGLEQFHYRDGRHFFAIYHDDEDSTQNEKSSDIYKADKIESFLGIGYGNLFKGIENEILFYTDSSSYDENTYDFEFTGNFTKIDENTKDYSYVEYQWVAYQSEEAGWVSEETGVEYGFVVVDGNIVSAKVATTYMFYLGEDLYYYAIDESVYTFYYNDGIYPTYTGEYFTE